MMRIINYQGVEQLAVFVTEQSEVEMHLSQNKNVIFLKGTTLYLFQKLEVSKYLISNENCTLQNGDVVLILKNGRIQKEFSASTASQTIVTTNQCNSNCIMCPYAESVRKKSKIPNTEYLLEFVRYLPAHTKHLVVTGGEPTLAQPGFFSMMLDIKNQFPDIQCLLLTNGRTFAIKKMAQLAKQTFPADTLPAIPIYSAHSNVHDTITQAQGSLKQAVNGIQHLLELQFPIEIRVVVSKLNLSEITDLARFLTHTLPSISVVNLMATEMCGNAAIHRKDVWIDYQTAFQSCIPGIEMLIANGIDVGLYNFPLCSVPKAYWGLYKKSISEYKIRYAPICETCRMKNLCGGVFQSALSLATQNFKPFYEEL